MDIIKEEINYLYNNIPSKTVVDRFQEFDNVISKNITNDFTNDELNKIVCIYLYNYVKSNSEILRTITQKECFKVNEFLIHKHGHIFNQNFFDFISLCVSCDKKLDYNFLYYIIKRLSYDENYYDKFVEIKKIYRYFDLTTDNIKSLLRTFGERCLKIIQLPIEKIELDEETILLLLSIYENETSYKIYINLVNLGKITPNIEHLKMVCLAGKNRPIIEFILTHKVIPTHECLELLFKTFDGIVCGKRNEYSTYGAYQGVHVSNGIIEDLTNHGLPITLDDVKLLAKHKIDIDIEKFGIKPDNELINICIDKKFKPEYLEGYVGSLENLHYLFTKATKLSQVRPMIKNSGLKCDNVCLQNACTIKSNAVIIKFLLNQGIKPDMTCIKNILKSNGNASINHIFNSIMDKLKIEN